MDVLLKQTDRGIDVCRDGSRVPGGLFWRCLISGPWMELPRSPWKDVTTVLVVPVGIVTGVTQQSINNSNNNSNDGNGNFSC